MQPNANHGSTDSVRPADYFGSCVYIELDAFSGECMEELVREYCPASIEDLAEFEWHDSVLLSVEYDRRASSRDALRLHVNLIVDAEQWRSDECILTLEECRLIRMEMHGGIECMSEGIMIDDVRVSTWGDLVDEARRIPPSSAPMALIELSLSSTGSKIQAVFERAILTRVAGDRPHPAPARLAPQASDEEP